MKKVIFSDIDGTLLTSKNKLSNKTVESIQKWLDNGNVFVPASGRSPKAIQTISKKISANLPMICFNGALVLDSNGNCLLSKAIPSSVAISIFLDAINLYPDIAWSIYSGGKWYTPKLPSNIADEQLVKVKSTFATKDIATKIKIFHKLFFIGNPKKLDTLKSILSAKYRDVNIVKSSPERLEIMDASVSKALGVQTILSYYKISNENSWAFGDNYNDLEMLNSVSHPFLMDNAPNDLKLLIKNHTLDNDHDGIAHILNNM